jgi:hypothetical protein
VVRTVADRNAGGADPDEPEAVVSNKYEDEVIERDDYGNKRTRHVRRDGLYDQARRIAPRLKGVSEHKLGKYLRDQGCTNDERVLRRRGWRFPPLADCRKRWLSRFPDTLWRNPKIEEWACASYPRGGRSRHARCRHRGEQ